MKNLQNPYQCGSGRVGSKKSKLTPFLPLGEGLKSHSIPALLSFRGGKNPRETKWEGTGQVGQDKIVIPKKNRNRGSKGGTKLG